MKGRICWKKSILYQCLACGNVQSGPLPWQQAVEKLKWYDPSLWQRSVDRKGQRWKDMWNSNPAFVFGPEPGCILTLALPASVRICPVRPASSCWIPYFLHNRLRRATLCCVTAPRAGSIQGASGWGRGWRYISNPAGGCGPDQAIANPDRGAQRRGQGAAWFRPKYECWIVVPTCPFTFDLFDLRPVAMITGGITFLRPAAKATGRTAQSCTRFSDQNVYVTSRSMWELSNTGCWSIRNWLASVAGIEPRHGEWHGVVVAVLLIASSLLRCMSIIWSTTIRNQRKWQLLF